MGDFSRNASRLSRIKMAEDVGKDACIRFVDESEFKELNEQMSQLKRQFACIHEAHELQTIHCNHFRM